ncbi:hypothetical protein KOAAANKH_00467 [Brevundimonas sp. NIBR10]|nr:hypothetical protein KOAAANKH_00467 [Brevundimonas sp. NIBR10]
MGWRPPRIPWAWPGSRRRRAEASPIDPWEAAPRRERVPDDTPAARLLSEIEAGALAVYAAHDLPTRPGQYARSPRATGWRYLADDLTAEERWALVLAQKDGSGWRFGSLEDIGDQPDSPPDLKEASLMLRDCHTLRTRLAERSGPDFANDVETAIDLGMAWRQLQLSPPRSVEVRIAPPAKPKKPRKSRAKPKPAKDSQD